MPVRDTAPASLAAARAGRILSCRMRLTSSYAVFRAVGDEQDLAKARWHNREGRLEAAEREYRAALARNPDLVHGWMELFDLLRRAGRHEDALVTALDAAAHFGPEAAVPLALQGAALGELGRTREAVRALEGALERDGNLALAWHELAYAAYRVGEYSRALLALDRAFALEPHTDTLMLRGRILREAGQFEASLVAFEGAHQSAVHEPQRRDAEREMQATRRAAALGGKRPKQFTRRERAFVESGATLLDAGTADADLASLLALCVAAFAALVHAVGWHPAAVAPLTADDEPLADALARALGAHRSLLAALDPADRPLVVTAWLDGGEDWTKQVERLTRWKAGTTFALVQAPGVTAAADVVGTVRGVAGAGDVYRALLPALRTRVDETPDVREAVALAVSPEAPWRRRILETQTA